MRGALLGSHVWRGLRMGPAERKRLRARAARGLGVPASPLWQAGSRLLEVTRPLGLESTARRAGADTRALPGLGGGGSTTAGTKRGGACAAGGPGRSSAASFLLFCSDVIGGSGWEPGGGGGGGAGRPPQVHVHVMKRHLTVGQDAREGARAGRTAAPPEPIAVAGLSMGEQEEGAVSATGPAAAAPR